MCGRYYVDDETAREIEKMVGKVDVKLQKERMGDVKSIVVTLHVSHPSVSRRIRLSQLKNIRYIEVISEVSSPLASI